MLKDSNLIFLSTPMTPFTWRKKNSQFNPPDFESGLDAIGLDELYSYVVFSAFSAAQPDQQDPLETWVWDKGLGTDGKV